MKVQRQYLLENNKDVYLDCYIADKISQLKRSAMLIIPGGGYTEICFEREGEPIALSFMSYGFNAFVLHYSVNKSAKFPAQLIEAALAIKHIKDNKTEYDLNDDLFVTGFSAGGHLAASTGIMWKSKEIQDRINAPLGYMKPKGILLIYPVISGIIAPHLGSFKNMLCSDEPSIYDLEQCSIEKYVDKDSCPAFIVHTSNDQIVNVKNSLILAEAYADNNLKFELHIYPDAPHGVALGNFITKCGNEKFENASISKWVENAVFWMNQLA